MGKGIVCGWNLYVSVHTKGKHGSDQLSLKEVAVQWKSLTEAERRQWDKKARGNPGSPEPPSYSKCDHDMVCLSGLKGCCDVSRSHHKKRLCGWNLYVSAHTKGRHGVNQVRLKDVAFQWESLPEDERHQWDEKARRITLSQLEGGGLGGTMGSPKKRLCGWNLYVSVHTKGRRGVDQIKLKDVAIQWKSLTKEDRQHWDEKAKAIPLAQSEGNGLKGSHKKKPCGWNLFVGVQTKGKHGMDKPSMKDVAVQWKSLTEIERQRWEGEPVFPRTLL